MSFLNPVNEPVLRFSSTDAGAPQINYATRVAGDVKTVLKACLVTGYGAKASAGWTAVNETATVIEFVSPSAAMSDYRLGIDDTSAASTAWLDVRAAGGVATKMGSDVTKDAFAINKTHADNGWDLLVTQRGFLFVENVVNTAVGGAVSRVTYYGQQKLATNAQDNISWWCVGHYAPAANAGMPSAFFDASVAIDKYYKIGVGSVRYKLAQLVDFKSIYNYTSLADLDVVENWYLSDGDYIIAQQPAVKVFLRTGSEQKSWNKQLTIAARGYLQVWPTRASTDFNAIDLTSHAIFLIPLDVWEY